MPPVLAEVLDAVDFEELDATKVGRCREDAAEPNKRSDVHGERLLDFCIRLRRPASLTNPKDVAWSLASYARNERRRVEPTQDRRR